MARLYCLLLLGCLLLTACDDRNNRTIPNSPAENPGTSGLTPTPTPTPNSGIGDAIKEIPKLKNKDSSSGQVAKLAALDNKAMRELLKDWCVDDDDNEILTNMRIVDFDDYVLGSSAPIWAKAILGEADDGEEKLTELRKLAIKDFIPSGEVLLADFDGGCDRVETVMFNGLAAAYLQKINGKTNAPTCSKVSDKYSDMYKLEIEFPTLSSLLGEEEEDTGNGDTPEKSSCPEDEKYSYVKATLLTGNTDGTLAKAYISSHRDTLYPKYNSDEAMGAIFEENGSVQFAKDNGMMRFLSRPMWFSSSKKVPDNRAAPNSVRNDTLKKFAKDWCGGALKNARIYRADDYLASSAVPDWYTPDHKEVVDWVKKWDPLREVVPSGDVVVADFDGDKACRKHIVIIDALAAKNLQTISTNHSSNALTCSKENVSSREKYLKIGIPALDEVWERAEEKKCLGEEDYTLAYVLSGHTDGTVALSRLRGKSEGSPAREVWKSYLFLMVEADGSVKFIKKNGALKSFSYYEGENDRIGEESDSSE